MFSDVADLTRVPYDRTEGCPEVPLNSTKHTSQELSRPISFWSF